MILFSKQIKPLQEKPILKRTIIKLIYLYIIFCKFLNYILVLKLIEWSFRAPTPFFLIYMKRFTY